MTVASAANTLTYDPELCINCGMCSMVCPHGVFEAGEEVAQLVRHGACMECGACPLNCPTGAIAVDSGVGCAYALMREALAGKKDGDCGCGPGSPCCS